MTAEEATMDAVFEVMRAHDAAEEPGDELVHDAYVLVEELSEQVEHATDYEDQGARRAVVLAEVENILLEDGLVEEPLIFRPE
jgi:hypothetical protein